MQKHEMKNLPTSVPTEIRCNCCGKVIPLQNGIAMQDFFHAEKTWGYFSQKDGITHSFDLCETCYDRIVSAFAIAPSENE